MSRRSFAAGSAAAAIAGVWPGAAARPSARHAPAHGPFAFRLPAPGTIVAISHNTLDDVAADPDERFSLAKVLGAWGSAAVAVVRTNGVVTDFTYYVFGGGHGDTGNDGVYRVQASTGLLSRALAPTKLAVSPTLDALHGENIAHRPDSQHVYQNLQALHSDEGGPALVQLYGSAVGQGAIRSGQAHLFTDGAWRRYGSIANVEAIPQAIVKDTRRRLWVRYPSNNGRQFYTADYTQPDPAWTQLTQGRRIGNWSDVHEACGCYDPVGDVDLAGTMRGEGSSLCFLPSADRTGQFKPIAFSGTVPTQNWGNALQYRAADDSFILVDSSAQPPNAVHVLRLDRRRLPDELAGTWTRRVFGGRSRFANVGGGEWFNRFVLVDAIDSLVCCPAPGAPMEAWRL
jgi:hypothetical protein